MKVFAIDVYAETNLGAIHGTRIYRLAQGLLHDFVEFRVGQAGSYGCGIQIEGCCDEIWIGHLALSGM
jgi:hypothetical protein